MTQTRNPARAPDWGALYATAETQAGHFTLAQAQACGKVTGSVARPTKRE